ncbi:MAG: methyltransferase family protein [Chloroflexota bacterium]
MVETQVDHADVKIHPPVLTLLHVAAAFVLNWLIPFPAIMLQLVKSLGVVLVLGGLALAFMAVRQFHIAHTTLDPHGSVKTLVLNGPYRFSRNPIYLGFVCTLIGLPLALGTFWGAVLSPLLVLGLDSLVIRREEAYLEKKFGDEYAGYRSRVRRWL